VDIQKVYKVPKTGQITCNSKPAPHPTPSTILLDAPAHNSEYFKKYTTSGFSRAAMGFSTVVPCVENTEKLIKAKRSPFGLQGCKEDIHVLNTSFPLLLDRARNLSSADYIPHPPSTSKVRWKTKGMWGKEGWGEPSGSRTYGKLS
jgi:hypothetical protein